MNLFVFGWNCGGELASCALDRLREVAGFHPQLDPDTRWSWTDGHGVFAGSVHTPQAALGSRRYVHRDDAGVTFFDGTAVDPLGELDAHDAGALRRAWDGLGERLEGQYVAVRIEGAPARVELQNDFLGMRQVYGRPLGDGQVFSNSAELLARLDDDWALDPLGVSSFLCWGWASGDRTLLRDVRVLPPGQRWSWKAGASGPRRETHYPASRLAELESRPLDAESIDSLADALAGQVRGLAHQYPEVTCGLTGGRDSRLLAALVAARGAPVQAVTYAASDSEEAKLASRVATALSLEHRVQPAAPGAIAEQWDEISRDLVLQNDGMVTLWQVAVMLDRAPRVDRLDVFLAGHGGEIGRGFYLEPQRVVLPSSRGGIGRFLAAKLLGSDAGLATAGARAEARAFVDAFVREKLEQGYAPGDVPDAFYTFDRVGRWAATVGMRPSLPVADVFEPFCTRPFVELAFSMPRAQRYAEGIHLHGIPQFAPALREIPFEKNVSRKVRLARDLARWLFRLDPSGRLERRRRARGVQVDWLGPLLPRIREQCLDEADAAPWQFVDRGAFERATAGAAGPLPAEAVLRVATCFQYWRERRACGVGSARRAASDGAA